MNSVCVCVCVCVCVLVWRSEVGVHLRCCVGKYVWLLDHTEEGGGAEAVGSLVRMSVL